MGFEDFESKNPRRVISATRNFYAGLVLLGKECLIEASPSTVEPMDILAFVYVPSLDEHGSIIYEAKGKRTVDLKELKERFKKFNLVWPKGNIDKLQAIRNNIAHYHYSESKNNIQEAIVLCFPIVEGLCKRLNRDATNELGNAWKVMLDVKSFFDKKKAECDNSFSNIDWFEFNAQPFRFNCPKCNSYLIYQTDSSNEIPELISGACLSCGTKFSAEKTISIIIQAIYGGDDYISIKEGGDPVIHSCP